MLKITHEHEEAVRVGDYRVALSFAKGGRAGDDPGVRLVIIPPANQVFRIGEQVFSCSRAELMYAIRLPEGDRINLSGAEVFWRRDTSRSNIPRLFVDGPREAAPVARDEEPMFISVRHSKGGLP